MFVRDPDFIAQILVSGVLTATNLINCIRDCYSMKLIHPKGCIFSCKCFINICTYKFEKNNSKENIKVVIDKEVI